MKLIILDRDGVINEEKNEYILTADDWTPIPGSLEAISKAKRLGFYIVVISNQSAIGREWMSMESLNLINRKMQLELSKLGGTVDIFLFCPHSPTHHCSCRKPSPTLLETFKERMGLDLTDVPFVGDRITDVETAEKVGAFPALVNSGKPIDLLPEGVPIYENLAEALENIVFGRQ